jgi:hypothetical protein
MSICKCSNTIIIGWSGAHLFDAINLECIFRIVELIGRAPKYSLQMLKDSYLQLIKYVVISWLPKLIQSLTDDNRSESEKHDSVQR